MTLFLRSSVTVGPLMALLLRMGMKMLVISRSIFHSRFSPLRPSMNPDSEVRPVSFKAEYISFKN